MEWIVLFIISWVLFLIFVNFRSLKRNIWAGVFAVVMQFMVDWRFTQLDLYAIKNAILYLGEVPLFFTLGPAFTMGILIAQYTPQISLLNILNVIFFFVVYSFQEYLLVLRNCVVYIKWSFWESLIINIGIMTTINWFSIVVLNKLSLLDFGKGLGSNE